MITSLRAGPYTVRGISVAGVYTSLQIPELDAVLDVGVTLRSFAGTDRVFLSHTHSDHASALISLLGIRNLIGKGTLQLCAPEETVPALEATLKAAEVLHHTRFDVRMHAMAPGMTLPLGHGWYARAFRTDHPAPSLGYAFIQKVSKLKPEFHGLPGPEIARRRKAGDSMVDEVERVELAYATDTRATVLDRNPWLFDARVLVLECTYVEASRTVEETQERGHLHLDELLARADRFQNEALVLMHFSQIYRPSHVHEVLATRLPESLRARTLAFAPAEGDWFG